MKRIPYVIATSQPAEESSLTEHTTFQRQQQTRGRGTTANGNPTGHLEASSSSFSAGASSSFDRGGLQLRSPVSPPPPRQGTASTDMHPTPARATPPAMSFYSATWPTARACTAALESLTVASERLGPRTLRGDSPDVTPFHSESVPPVRLDLYVRHLLSSCGYGWHGFALAIAVLRRYCNATGALPCALTVHRLMLACITVATKASYDRFVRNVYMARIGSVELSELNWLELSLLGPIGFAAVPSHAEVVATVGALASGETFLSFALLGE
mmetsp:Transcript_41893/g.129499  ORF Transcript_41893/g.129499 Transcript_41893/m.129499 type:complete len:271 (-) Transcript_41893:728-1540(-)